MVEEQLIKKLAEELLSGSTMLSEACPNCGLPLFRRGDSIFCSQCGEIEEQTEEEEKKDKTKEEIDIDDFLNKKRQELLERLLQEKDIRIVNEILDALLKIAKLTDSCVIW